jgi:hypothetical protein
VRLKHDFKIFDHEGKPTGEIRHKGEIWRVLTGAEEDPNVVWLEDPSGEFHAWPDDESVWRTFDLIASPV